MRLYYFVFILLLASCSSLKPLEPIKPAKLLNTWVYTDSKLQPTLTFADTRVSGFGGCNRFFGGYTRTDDSLKFGLLGSTKKLCIPEANDVESTFFKKLNEVAFYEIHDDTLLLLSKDKTLLMNLELKEK